MKYYLLLFAFAISYYANCQSLSAKRIIENSIQFHDPKNELYLNDYRFYFKEKRPDGTTRKTNILLGPKNENFEVNFHREERTISYVFDKNGQNIYLDGNEKISNEDTNKFRLSEKRGLMLKNYYLYLWHLPRKLKDPGTLINENVEEALFNKYDCYKVKVNYDLSVGKDIWYFYFDKITFQLRGYRFYHDEAINDGEYIYLDNLVEIDNIKIPAQRAWYTHKEDKYLGSDILIKISK